VSVQATTWVWANSKAKESTLLVALAIADGANKEGSESCQSVRTLGSMARCSESTVHRALKWLADNGEIECIGTNPRYRNTNIYRFVAMWNPAWDAAARGVTHDTSQNDTPVTGDTQGVSSETERGVTHGTQPQVHTPEEHPTASHDVGAPDASSPAGEGVDAKTKASRDLAEQIERAFEHWWSVYPRKVDKGHARKAYEKALKKAKPSEIGPGLVRAVAAWTEAETPTDKIPYPATWLNGERWTDDLPDPTESGTTTGTEENSWMRRTPASE
jgi:hypothetical protein